MIAIILAAGYATRMYPLTENFPKSLLPIKGKPLMNYMMDDILTIKEIKHYYIVTNNKFYHVFDSWIKETYANNTNITLVNDGTNSNDTRLGAVGDIKLVLNKFDIEDEIFVLASDNLYEFSMQQFVDFYQAKKQNSIMIYEENDFNKLRKTGVAEVDGDTLLSFEEKPNNPKDKYGVPPFYIYTKESTNEIRKIEDKMDAPGNLISYLRKDKNTKVYHMTSKRIDVGDLNQYYDLNGDNRNQKIFKI